MGPEIILAALGVAAKHGFEYAYDLFQNWNENEPITIERIKEYELEFEDPHKYFSTDD